MNKTTKNVNSKLPEIGAVILVVIAVGYYFYSSGSGGSSSSFTVSTATSSVGADVLSLLNQIHSLKIDTGLFQSPEYQSLTDFTVTVPAEPIGKANPFVPAGVSGNAPTAPASPSTSTAAVHH